AGEPEARALIRWRPRDGSDQRWTVVQSRPVLGDDGRVLLAISVLHDITVQRGAETRSALLAEVSALLNSSLDYDETLQRIVRLLVPTLGEWSVLHIIEGDKVRWLAGHRDPAYEERLRALAQIEVPLTARGALPETLFTGRSTHVDFDDAALASRMHGEMAVAFVRAMGTRSSICAPLI